jgi:hypothetical protein
VRQPVVTDFGTAITTYSFVMDLSSSFYKTNKVKKIRRGLAEVPNSL